MHLQRYKASGAELIMGEGRFVAPKTLEVRLNDGGTHLLLGDRVFLNLEHMQQFRAFPASMLLRRSPISRRWNSIVCPCI